jgi:hypothetical protein
VSLKEDLEMCEMDIKGCYRPSPCESCDTLRRIISAIDSLNEENGALKETLVAFVGRVNELRDALQQIVDWAFVEPIAGLDTTDYKAIARNALEGTLGRDGSAKP